MFGYTTDRWIFTGLANAINHNAREHLLCNHFFLDLKFYCDYNLKPNGDEKKNEHRS